jgi:hypothetical protein
MRFVRGTSVFCLAIALALAGCGKNAKAMPPVALNGISIDLPKLQQSCGSSNPTVLGKLANNPEISESQKKTINDVSEQVKKAFANAAPNSANNTVQ